MLLPKNMPRKLFVVILGGVCALHGCAFGILYAPAQAWMFGFSFEQTLAWIAAGIPFDVIHGVGNAVLSVLILPLTDLLNKLESKSLGRLGTREK